MKYDNGERYLKEIDHVSILESIDEMFDGATSLLTLNAVMYGSTITALIAGLPICGDLDIATSNQEYMRLCQNFASSVRWVQINGKRIPEYQPTSYNKGRTPYTNKLYSNKITEKNPYAEAKHLPVAKTAVFQSVNNNCVQIVESKSMTGDRLEDALEIIRKVDFTFCGIAVDRYGRMLEVIPYAYDDCNQKVIRIQNYQNNLDPVRLKQRLQKYLGRGWSLTMSIDQIMTNLNKAKMEYTKGLNKKSKSKKKTRPVMLFRIVRDTKRGWILETKKEVVRMIGSAGTIDNIVKRMGKSQLGITMISRIDGSGHLIFWANGNNLSGSSAKRLVELLSKQLIDEFRLDPKRIINENKKAQSVNDWASSFGEDKMRKANSIHDLISGEKYGESVSTASTSASLNSKW